MSWMDRFWSKVDKSGDCWLWTGARDHHGYGKVKVKGHHLRATRALWSYLYGDPGDLFVLHRCDVTSCVRPDHLFLGTHQDNMDDMAAKGRRRGNIRLRPEQVAEIRRIGTSMSSRQVAARYGIGPTQVKRIRNREQWSDVA